MVENALKLADGSFLPESEVICEYLEQRHSDPPLLPAEPEARARCRLLSRIADIYIMNPMMPLFKNFSRATRDQAVVDLALANIRGGLEYLDNWIAPGPYAVGGAISLADFAVAPILRYVAQYPPVFGMKAPMEGLSNVSAYFEACRKDPHIERGLSRIETGWAALRG